MSWTWLWGLYPRPGQPTACPIDTPYEPILVIPSSMLQSLDPLWATCSGDLRGLYDPPYALHGAAAAAAPTPSSMPLPPIITPAPGPFPDPGQPIQTQSPSPPSHSLSPGSPIADPQDPPDNPNDDPGKGDLGNTDLGSSDPSNENPAHSPDGSSGSHGQGNPEASNSESIVPHDSNNDDGNRAGSIGGGDPGSSGVDDLSAPNAAMIDHILFPDPGSSATAAEAISIQGQTSGSGSDLAMDHLQIGGKEVVADPSNPSAVVIGGSQTLGPGATAIINHTPVSLGPNGLAIPMSSTIPIPQSVVAGINFPLMTMGGKVFLPDRANPSNVIIGGQTLRPGETTFIDDTSVSLGLKGLVIASSSILATPRPTQDLQGSDLLAVFSVGDGTYTAHPGRLLVIQGQTLDPEDHAVQVTGKTISLGLFGVVINGVTQSFSSTGPTKTGPMDAEPTYTEELSPVNGEKYTAFQLKDHPGTALIFGPNGIAASLSVGSPGTVINGETVSLDFDSINIQGSDIRFMTATSKLEWKVLFTDAAGRAHTAIEKFDQAGAHTIAVIDGSITLSLGGSPATINGDFVRLAPNGLKVNGTLEAWSITTAAFNAPLSTSRLAPLTEATGTAPSATSIQLANASKLERNCARMWVLCSALALILIFL